MNFTHPPRAALWLSIPDACLMRSEFEAGDYDLPDIKIILGCNSDDTQLLFEREALERFVALAQQMLAVPVTPESEIPRTFLESSYGYDIRDKTRFAVA